MKNRVLQFHRDVAGITAIEYALLASLIAVIILGSVVAVGTQLQQLYENVKDQVVQAIQ